MARDVVNSFISIWWVIISISSFDNQLFISLAHLLIGLFGNLIDIYFLNCAYALDTNSLSDI